MIKRQLLLAAFIILSQFAAQANVELKGILEKDVMLLKENFLGITSKKLKPHEIDQVIQFLMKNQNYESIDAIGLENGHVLIRAIPLRKVSTINVNGNRKIEDSTVLSALNVKIGSNFNANQISSGAEKIKELYGREGYFNTSIGFSFSEKDPANTVLDITIDEGDPCRITNIQFESTNKELIKKLQKQVREYRNEVFTESIILDIEKELASFMRKSRYLNAKIEQKDASYNPEKTKASLVYRVLDVYRYEISFSGNKSYTNGDLMRALNLNEFDTGSVDPSTDVVKIILNKYISGGYAFARLNLDEQIDEKNYVRRLVVQINEGPQVKVKKYDITGRLSRSPRYYATFIENNSSDAVDDGFFVKSDIENGIKNLLASLNNEGFLRARIQSTRYEFSKENKEATIKLVLDEGPLTQLRAINFEGNVAFSNEQLLEVIDLKANEPLQLDQLESSIQKLFAHYQNSGFIEMRLENRDDQFIQYDDKGAQANVIFKITEGPLVRVQNILLEGNTFTKESVIMRKLEIKKGQILSLYEMDEAKKRLERMGLFARAELRTLEANSKVSDRTLIVSVTEQDPGIFRIGFGVNNERELTLRGFTGASYNNINGSARAISARLNIQNNIVKTQYNEYEASVSYLEPFIIRSKFRGRVNYTRQEKVVENYDSDYKSLRIQQSDKLGFIAERDLTSNIRFSWTAWSFETVREFLHGKPLATGFDNSEQKIATVGPLLDFDFRDNPLLPTRGTFVRVEADYSDPAIGSSSKVNFIRTQSTVSHYLRLKGPEWVWANSVRGGYGRNLSSEGGSGIPESYSFFLGGFTTMRGYSGTPSDRIPSERAFKTLDGNQLIIPKETSYYLVKSELRYPIYGVIGGVLFTDIGNVRINKNATNAGYDGPKKQTYGVGIRINTPVGPLSLDYARKVDVDRCISRDTNGNCERESPDQWHLSIGTF
jgi:outer membrane protein insertion porin family